MAGAMTQQQEAEREIKRLKAREQKLENRIKTLVEWLDENQPDVWTRGIWDRLAVVSEAAHAAELERGKP